MKLLKNSNHDMKTKAFAILLCLRCCKTNSRQVL